MINTRPHYLLAVSLFTLGAFIWIRSGFLLQNVSQALPILAAFPLFIWLGNPWKLLKYPESLSVLKITLSVLLFLLGIVGDITLFLALGWTLLFWTCLRSLISPDSLPRVRKLLPLCILAFPWISLDFDRLGWWFRLSGAWVTEWIFTFFGSTVTREGTLLTINHVPISVDAACAGLGTLQTMLIVGVVPAYLILSNTPYYWICFPLLMVLSWITNTLRIIVITMIALYLGASFANGPLHALSGAMIISLMFVLSWRFFAMLKPKETL